MAPICLSPQELKVAKEQGNALELKEQLRLEREWRAADAERHKAELESKAKEVAQLCAEMNRLCAATRQSKQHVAGTCSPKTRQDMLATVCFWGSAARGR